MFPPKEYCATSAFVLPTFCWHSQVLQAQHYPIGPTYCNSTWLGFFRSFHQFGKANLDDISAHNLFLPRWLVYLRSHSSALGALKVLEESMKGNHFQAQQHDLTWPNYVLSIPVPQTLPQKNRSQSGFAGVAPQEHTCLGAQSFGISLQSQQFGHGTSPQPVPHTPAQLLWWRLLKAIYTFLLVKPMDVKSLVPFVSYSIAAKCIFMAPCMVE